MFRRKTKISASEFSQQGDVRLVEHSDEHLNQPSTIPPTQQTRVAKSSPEHLARGNFATLCKRYAIGFVLLLTVSVAITFLCPVLLEDQYSSPKVSMNTMLGQSVLVKPHTADDYFARATVYERLGDFEHATSYAKSGLRMQQDHVGCNYLLGYMQLESGDLDTAVKTFEKLVAHQSILDGYYGLACTSELRGNAQKAEEYLNNSIKQLSYERQFVQRAEFYVRQGKIKEALADYDAAIALTSDGTLKAAKIALLVHVGRIEDARKELKRFEFTPDEIAFTFADLPEVMYASGRQQAMVDVLTKNLNYYYSDPLSVAGWYERRAKLFELMGEKERARKDRSAIMDILPKQFPAAKGYYLEQAGDFEHAFDAYAEAGKTTDNWANEYLPNRWRCLVLMGHEDKAIQETKAFLAKNPNHGAYVALALAELKKKNGSAALAATDAALRFNLHDGDIYNLRADAYALLQDKQKEAENRGIAKRLGRNGDFEQYSHRQWWHG